MSNGRSTPKKTPNPGRADLDEEVVRIKNEYSRRFGPKFQLPLLDEGEEGDDARNKKIEEVKRAFLKKLPPTG